MDAHTRWFNRVTGGASGRSAGAAADVSSATLNRQLARGALTPDMVIAIARGYGRSPVTALVETGYLTFDEAHHLDVVDSARLLSDQQLVRELARRVDDNEAAWQGTFDDVVDEATSPDNVVDLGARSNTGDEETRWAARQSDVPSPGEALHKHLDGLGEESQLGPDDD